jgi:hypothetical protein
MVLYQIRASGATQLFDRAGNIYSKQVYRSREEAEQAIPKFKKSATTEVGDLDMCALQDDENLKFRILELELV